MDLIIEEDIFKNYNDKLREYLENEEVKKLLLELGTYDNKLSLDENVKKVKKYIFNELKGQYKKEEAVERFFKCVDAYLKNDDFIRVENCNNRQEGFVDYNLILPISSDMRKARNGFRVGSDILGYDRKRYILKAAEGLKGGSTGRKHSVEARYNPTVAYAFFKFLNQPCAKNIPVFEKEPYYHILSKNFLNKNEEVYGLDDDLFMQAEYCIDENLNITHKQILKGIEETVIKKGLSEEKTSLLCKKIKLQYAVQETLKSLICSMDQNLGNTSFVIKKDEEGNIEDINISPAYDLDLSFNLGEEMLRGIPSKMVLYRTTQNGRTDLESIIEEFQHIEGYKETIKEIKDKLNDNYTNKILDIAYEESGAKEFSENRTRESYTNFIMRRVATFKQAYKNITEREDKIIN